MLCNWAFDTSGYNGSARCGAPVSRFQSLSEIILLGERPTPWSSNYRCNTLQQDSRICLCIISQRVTATSHQHRGLSPAPSSRQTHRVFPAILPRSPNHAPIKLPHARFCRPAKDLGYMPSVRLSEPQPRITVTHGHPRELLFWPVPWPS
ncbi:hypothetical protein CSPX01_02528 [Colletotrichum filicis]|nr:hypothetical protein CSPX01_02528 [Colletotrichum filicis]